MVEKPRSLVLTYAGGGERLARLDWRHWGARRATARGPAVVDDCRPSCAQGRVHRYPVALAVARLRGGEAELYYRRAVVRFLDRRPRGLPRRQWFALTDRGPLAR